MGRKAQEQRQKTKQAIARRWLSEAEVTRLASEATYKGSPYHKRNPGDFKLDPPPSPRPDATLCDEAQVFTIAKATELFGLAIQAGLASIATTSEGLPKRFWVVDTTSGHVFEAMDGGNRQYHGYPVRQTNPTFHDVSAAWGQRSD
ncbi:MAG: hypothetical protein H7338_05295 [Candidatus Sericytochromatia bacterium]|nr:hypothetical protein [Candidatus Sericytochromatia bacterium]